MIKNFVAAVCLLMLISCTGNKKMQSQASDKGLKDYYKKYFPIGVAVTPQSLRNPEQQKLILKEFNSLTPENAMKMGPIHPRENEYNWRNGDAIISFAQRNGLKAHGHTLV